MLRDRLFAEVNGAPGGSSAGLSLLSLRNGHLWGTKFGPPSPKAPIRFAVGEPGWRSSVWRVWANPKKGDVYIASRKSARIFKISLYESGDWRCQWAKEDHEDVVYHPYGNDATAEGRILAQWQRPPANSAGWTDALSIWVPGEDISTVPGDGESPIDSQWIAPPGTADAVEFRFWLVEPRRGRLDLTTTLREGKNLPAVVNGFRLATGEVLVIFAALWPLDDERLRSLTEIRAWARTQLDPAFDVSPSTGPRTAAIEIEEDGHPNVWDLSLS